MLEELEIFPNVSTHTVGIDSEKGSTRSKSIGEGGIETIVDVTGLEIEIGVNISVLFTISSSEISDSADEEAEKMLDEGKCPYSKV